jgi:hydrogenase maturation protein HypF
MKRLMIRVYGIVQGVGFRPFVSRTAQHIGITGSVCNKGPYVEIFAEGIEKQVDDFLYSLKHDAPERSAILKLQSTEEEPQGSKTFEIIKSAKEKGDIFVSPDIAICKKCSAELFDKNDKRYLHPFINCTACGPRLTILDSMPYDRVRTSMGEFPMCPDCEYEYTHVETRRYHAQPVCCNDCGPQLYIPGRNERGKDALIYVREVIRHGGIAAIKGIGGFHLCCDATDATAVSRLRQLKHRPQKPFAVMIRDMETVKRECVVEQGEEPIIDGPQKPIILLKRLATGKICEEVAPGNPNVGVMLPYAPVQLLMFSYPDGRDMTDCFVMTSGNPSGAPICRDDAEAVPELSPMCDVILSNNRKIRLRADDSVMAFYMGKPYMVRRSRGYAPLPFIMSKKYSSKVLAVGGELKNTFCLSTNDLFYPSPYIGDLADLRSVKALGEAIKRMEQLLEIEPQAVACDMHPRYNSTMLAKEMGLPVIEIQHHYAHIVSCMAENDWQGCDVIGVSFDGTGYGTDGTIWGGEFLLSSYRGFERLGSIMPFRQAGGDISSKEGWRIAVSMLYDALGTKEAVTEANKVLKLCDEENLKMQFMMLDKNINCVKSTSAGRLFDAVSAILGIRRASTFEGEASMALEFAADSGAKAVAEPSISQNGDIFALDTNAVIKALYEGRRNGMDISGLAGGFHSALAQMILAGCRLCREKNGVNTAALSGGVFQNMLLMDKCRKLLEADGFTVLIHSLVPPNDGGIALGQAVVAAEKLENNNIL